MSYLGLYQIASSLFDYKANGTVIDVDRTDEIVDDPTSIGKVTASGAGVSDNAAELAIDATLQVTATFDGDAADVVYQWSSYGDAIKINGAKNKANVTIQGKSEGEATIRCQLTSAKSDDSPTAVTVTITVPPAENDLEVVKGASSRKK